jgi:alkylhydroperoxidase family enzyme
MTTCTLCGLEPMECEHAPVEFFGEPTAPPPTLEDDLSLEDAATSYILKHHVDNYHDKQPLPLPCVECTIAFARQQVSAARAEADAKLAKVRELAEEWVAECCGCEMCVSNRHRGKDILEILDGSEGR